MREILFRGKDEDGDWLESMSLAPHITENGIITSYYIGTGYNTVAAETVGQYTGLTDKKGNKIFEGDILLVGGVQKVLVGFERGHFVVNHFAINILCSRNTESEIVGNIHDNPELLKGE